MTTYLIELQSEADATGVDTRALERLALHALATESVPTPTELSILLADDATVRELNRTYRHIDATTDVLSFSQSEGEIFARPNDAASHLGDVIISIDTARRQALEYGIALDGEVAHLLVHGILHLLGYDHEQPDDAAAMRLQEEEIMGRKHRH
jgi:probable rRNA maturation factor